MTDQELLELAAKAAGIEYDVKVLAEHKDGRAFFGLWLICHDEPYEGQRRYWNPLTDDGDALRLAVKLGISFDWVNQADYPNSAQWASSPVGLIAGPDTVSKYGWVTNSFGDDPYAATRRAIVRAAAEIGKEL